MKLTVGTLGVVGTFAVGTLAVGKLAAAVDTVGLGNFVDNIEAGILLVLRIESTLVVQRN